MSIFHKLARALLRMRMLREGLQECTCSLLVRDGLWLEAGKLFMTKPAFGNTNINQLPPELGLRTLAPQVLAASTAGEMGEGENI